MTEPTLLPLALGILAVDLGRYLLVAGGAFLVFWMWGRGRFAGRWIGSPRALAGSAGARGPADDPQAREKRRHDFRWSLSTVAVFATTGVLVKLGGDAGVFRRYTEVAELGWAWTLGSVPVLLVLQDTYFYWTHRAMHHPRLFRVFHRVHHRSVQTSPWTAYAFSPLEAAVHAAFVPLAWLVLPLHEAAVFAFLMVMIVMDVLGHLSLELYPRGFSRGPLTGWLSTTTHHALHHRHPRGNFGLYLTLWDRLMGTTDPEYHATFGRLTGEHAVPTRSADAAPARPSRPTLRSLRWVGAGSGADVTARCDAAPAPR